MRLPGLVALCLILALPAGAAAAESPRERLDRLIGAAYRGRALFDLEEMTDLFGPRVSGSDGYNKAADWAAAKLRAAGLTVHFEPFTMVGWQRGPASGRVIAPSEHVLHLASWGWSPPTPPGGVSGEVFALTDASEDFIKKNAAALRGKIVLYDKAAYLPPSVDTKVNLMRAPARLRDAGVLAVIVPGRTVNDVLGVGDATWGEIAPLPMATIGLEDALMVKRMLERPRGGPVKLEINLDNKIAGQVQVRNVIGELKGREQPDEWLLVGAHLDSWDFATGAQDNGAGVVEVIDAARILAAAGIPPRRSIRFALWGGEEEGLIGSRAYVHAHAGELDHCFVVLNTDNGAGHPQGWKVESRPDVREALFPVARDVLAPLGGGTISDDTTFDTDHAPFVAAGVPAMDMLVNMSGYEEVHHKAADTIDKVGIHDLSAGTAVLVATAWSIAELEKFAPRLSGPNLEAVLKHGEYDVLIQAIGNW